MLDIGSDSGTPQRDVDKFIKEALKVWEEYGFKDMDLWETFQDDYKDFTEEDFKSASNYNTRKLRAYLRKYGVWVRKQQRYSSARSLYDALLEEEPTKWTEEEITACEEDENFDSYKISRLIDSDFGRKPRKSRALTPTSPTGPPPAANPISPSTPSGTGFPPAAHTPPGTGPTPEAYMQPPSTGFVPAAYPTPGIGPPSPVYIQPPGIGPPPATTVTTSTSHGKELSRFSVDPPQAMITTSTGHGKELPNLAKICTDEVKCSGRNDSFTLKLAIFHDICSRADVLPEAKMKAFPTMLKGPALNNYPSNIGISGTVMNSDQVRYSIRKKWIKWDKTPDGIDETRAGVG